jgi:hypothetical protein
MQYQKTGKNTVKPLKQIHTVEVTGSNPVPPTNNIKGLWLMPYPLFSFLLPLVLK